MAYGALERLRWGDGWIEPGEDVPAGERGRNYAALLAAGRIAEIPEKRQRPKEEPKDDPAVGEDAEPTPEPSTERPKPRAHSKSAPKSKAKASGRSKK